MLATSALFCLSTWALARSLALERWAAWDFPRRLMILAPHEDDCVISAGGIGIRTFAVGTASLAATPVQPGLVDVSATVTLQADIL